MARTRVVLLAVLVALTPVVARAGDSSAGFYIAAFHERITDGTRAELSSTGLHVVDYEPENSYIVWGSRDQAARAQAMDAIRAVAPVPPERKLNEALAGARGAVTVEVSMRGARGIDEVSDLGSLAGIRPARANGSLSTVRLTVDAAKLGALVDREDVLYVSPAGPGGVEDEGTAQIQAGNLVGAFPTPGYRAWLQQIGLDGSGVRVAIVDTGISNFHPDFSDRIVASFTYGAPAQDLDDGGHGSHVAGIVAGSPPEQTDAKDLQGFSYGQGVAPGAELIRQSGIATAVVFPPGEGLQIFSRDSWRSNARLWNASWHTGGGDRIGYSPHVRDVDVMARDADWAAAGPEEFLMIFSAGNSGTNGPTEPKEAKNIITVGSVDSGRSRSGFSASNQNVSSFSSRGPTKDGRIFPTVVAPGGEIVSARGPESAMACTPEPTGGPLYYSCSGTSMASPHVAGAAALLHQWWKRERGTLPSPTVAKALFVNTAQDVGTKNIPNHNEGWGRVNLTNLFAGIPEIVEDQTTTFGAPDESFTRTVNVVDAARPLKVTLAWADAPAAEGTTRALVNDLNLVVERLDDLGNVVQTWLGNKFFRGESIEGGTADKLNNVENVFLNAPAAGAYRVTVSAFNVPGDGVPFNADDTDQDFALLVRN